MVLYSMCVTISISTGLYPNLDLWNENKLQLQLQLQCSCPSSLSTLNMKSTSSAEALMSTNKYCVISQKNESSLTPL